MTMETIILRPEEGPTEATESNHSTDGRYVALDRTIGDAEPKEMSTDENDSETEEDGDYPAENDDEIADEMEAFEDLPVNAALHAADEMKKRLEEVDPCEKLRALCKKGEVENLEAWLKTVGDGVDIDYISSDGWTCLHEIITHGCQFTAIARILLEHGAMSILQISTKTHPSMLPYCITIQKTLNCFWSMELT